MNKKQIIQIVVIVAAFGGAGFVLYQGGIFGPPGGTAKRAIPIIGSALGVGAGPGGKAMAAQKPESILPYGDNLDISKAVDEKRFRYNIVTNPKLDPKNDVGITESGLIIPPPVAK